MYSLSGKFRPSKIIGGGRRTISISYSAKVCILLLLTDSTLPPQKRASHDFMGYIIISTGQVIEIVKVANRRENPVFFV